MSETSNDVYSKPDSDILLSTSETIDTPSIQEILFSFKGRLNRQRYWLAYLGFYAVIFLLYGLLVGGDGAESQLPLWALLFYIPLFWVGLALQIKRFHDRNKSGWWVLIGMVPIIGPIWVLVELGFLGGDDGANRFGNPVI